MIKLAPIAKTFIKEGGKLFGSRAVRVTTAEMNSVFEEVKEVKHKKKISPRIKSAISRARSNSESSDVRIKKKSSDERTKSDDTQQSSDIRTRKKSGDRLTTSDGGLQQSSGRISPKKISWSIEKKNEKNQIDNAQLEEKLQSVNSSTGK